MRSHHDMGGQPAGAIEPSEHDYQIWEKRVDAFMVLLSRKGLMTVDELRKNIEKLPPDAYDRMGYYDRWMASICNVLIERGAITIDELRAKLADIEKNPAAHSA